MERLLDVCNRWNLSISLAKSFWGRRKVDYLGHQVSLAGLEAKPKDLGSLVKKRLHRSLRPMQSFLGSLKYYSRFIKEFSRYASVMYELREADLHEIGRAHEDPKADKVAVRHRPNHMTCKGDHDQYLIPGGDQELHSIAGGRSVIVPSCWRRSVIVPSCRGRSEIAPDRWGRSGSRRQKSLGESDDRIHFPETENSDYTHFETLDTDRPPVIVVYASKWAVSAALLQKHEGVYWPITFSNRTLKPNEVNYGMVEKEVLLLLRMLDICYTMLVSRGITVLTR